MAAPQTQISTVTIPALVLSLNNVLFVDPLNNETVIGKVLNVPVRDILWDNTDRWAIPIKDSGNFTGMDFEYKNGQFLTKPSYDSLPCFRIRYRDTTGFFEWMIYGTRAEFMKSASTAPGADAIPMPGVSATLTSTVEQRVAPCQTIDLVDGSGNNYMLFAIPNLDAGEIYYPYGSYNNIPFPTASSAGYATPTLLLAYLNATWTGFVWTYINGETLVATGGTAGLDLCVVVLSVLPS